jgi:hypothetical protein
VKHLTALNQRIGEDRANLGPGYRIGHSFFCPLDGVIPDEIWYRRVIATEIRPLLEEYWSDPPERAAEEADRLLEGL